MDPNAQTTLVATIPRQMNTTRHDLKKSSSSKAQMAKLNPKNWGISPFTNWVFFTRTHGSPLSCTGSPVAAANAFTRFSSASITFSRSSVSNSLALTKTIIKLALVLSLYNRPR